MAGSPTFRLSPHHGRSLRAITPCPHPTTSKLTNATAVFTLQTTDGPGFSLAQRVKREALSVEIDPNQAESASPGRLERLATFIYGLRAALFTTWRLALLMAKGAYLVGERRRLFQKLGEEFHSRFRNGQMHPSELEPLVHQIERLSKKLEIEERLVWRTRFGSDGGESSTVSA